MIMDEVFGNNKFVNEVIWHYSGAGTPKGCWAKRHDNIYVYSKTTEYTFNADAVRTDYAETTKERFSHAINNVRNGINFGTQSLNPLGKYPEDVLDVSIEAPSANVRTGYPTQKPEALLEKIIEASSNPGDIVFDCFMGSGTTQAVAMKLGRKFIGADINLGAIQTTTKRLIGIANDIEDSSRKYTGFEVYNVNNYDFFRNPVEARNLLIEALEVQPFSQSDIWDDSDFNIVISNTQKIIVKKKRKEPKPGEVLFGSGSLLSSIYGDENGDTDDAWDDASLMDNQRFKKLCRLPQLGVYVDEAHHLFGADLEKQIRKKTANKTSLRDTINMLAERTSIVACYNYTGTPYVNKQVLPEVVYAYGLRESIWNGYLKDADPIAFENVKDTEFLRMAVTTFWERYGGKTYEGLNPKLAIYASRVEEAVNEVRPALEEILADLGIPASSILVNVGETKYTKDEDIRNFNDLDVQGSQGNEKQFIILVDKEKEGWNCRSLFGVAMFRNPNSKIFVLQATMRCLRTITDDRLTATVFLSKENYDTLDDELHKNFNMDIKNMKTNTGAPKTVHKVRVLPPPRTITLKKIWHEYKLEEKVYSTPIDFKVRDIDYSKYASVMYEKDTIARDSSLKEKNIDYIRDQMKFSAFSLAGELARYLNISCILTSRILRESVDGIDAILEAVNKYNEILNDVIVPGVFHALYEVKSELHTEDKELVLLKEPKDAGYYEFSAKDELVITNQYKALTQEQIAKSFHADTYCFDSKPEKECFLQYITNSKIKEVYFTGMFTANQGDLSVQYYDPESGRIRHYYPDFLAKLEDGSYQLIEVKGDNKIDDTVVKAKAAAAQEMAVASGIEYKMYAGSEIMTTHILAYLDGMASTISYADHMQQGTLSMVAETSAPYGSDK